jgi:RNA polymerase sigma factor (sigma-70 family)
VTVEPFEHVVAEHGAAVLRVCRALLRPADADDAWSETFIAALRAFPDLPAGSNVRGWLVTIAYRKAIDQTRRDRRAPLPVADVPERPSSDAIPEPVDGELRAALDRLPPKQRAAVVYHHLAGLPYAEVGTLLDSSEAAARRSAADGVAALRRALGQGPPRGGSRSRLPTPASRTPRPKGSTP